MIQGAWQIVLACVAVAVVAGYVCRLGLLDIRQHQLSIVFMHAAFCGAAVGVGVRAWHLEAGIEDALSLLGSALWLSISLRTWAHGVPTHYQRKPPPNSAEVA